MNHSRAQESLSPRHLGIVGLFFVVAAVVMSLIPLQDPSEGRYAVVAQNMLLSGDWITPVTTEDGIPTPFLGKPPMQFWLIAASLYVFGHNEAAARLPSLVETGLTLFVVFRFASICLSPTIGLIALLIQLSSLIGFFFAGACMTDPLLALSVVTTTLALPMVISLREQGRNGESQNWEYALFLALSAGLLCKGPIAVVLSVGSLLPWVILHRPWLQLAQVRWIRGAAITVAFSTPWYLLAELRQPGFLNYFIVHENILRFLVKKYGDLYGSGHRHFRGMIWLMTMLACMPWLLIGLLVGARAAANRRQPITISPYAWCKGISTLPSALLIPAGLALFPPTFFTLSRQVSIYYTLPSIPALSLLLSLAIVSNWQGGEIFYARIEKGVRTLAFVTIAVLASYSYITRPDLSVMLWTLCIGVILASIEWSTRKCSYSAPQIRSIFFVAGFLVTTYFSGALFQLTDYVGGGSCRDLIRELRLISPDTPTVFYQKLPHSALFYARANPTAPLTFEITNTIPSTINAPFVIREKTYKKLKKHALTGPLDLAARKNVLEGGWILFTKPL